MAVCMQCKEKIDFTQKFYFSFLVDTSKTEAEVEPVAEQTGKESESVVDESTEADTTADGAVGEEQSESAEADTTTEGEKEEASGQDEEEDYEDEEDEDSVPLFQKRATMLYGDGSNGWKVRIYEIH